MSKFAFVAIALLCAMGLPPDSHAQEYHGGPLEGSYVQYPGGGPLSIDPGCLVGLNVVLHILRGPQGEGGITTNEALASFEYLNDVFSAYNITFVHLDDQNPVRVHNLPNYSYWPLPEYAGLTVSGWYREANAINIYYVDGASNEGWLGFTTSRSAADMFIRTGYQTLYPMIHEMGHCFGLRHTHGDPSSHDELVTRGPGANCATAGDMLCDTPAEPWNNDGGIRTYVNMSCEYTGTFKDANDEYYTPDTHNYMSYTNIHDCYTHFSAGQVALMRSYIANDQFLIFQTIAGQRVRFANIVGGQEHASGDIRIYDTYDNAFHTGTSPFEIDLPACISYSAHTLSERLLSQASVYEKHQSWNEDFGTFKLKKTLSIPMSQTVWDEQAWFRPMSPLTLTVESDGGTLAPNILFKDPWFMETDGSQPVSFLSFAAPHSPTGARAEQTGGVFEHLNNPDFPKYLYQANRYLDGNLDAKQLPLDVGDWVCTGMYSSDANAAEVLESAEYPDLVSTRFAPTLTRIVQVNQDNAEVRAEYKAHRCSVNNERPSAGNSQRRIVFDKLDASLQQSDRHYAVYESDGRIYLIMSEDAGSSWSAEALVTDPSATCKRPSLAIADYDEAPGLLYLVYVDVDNSEVVLKKRESWSSLSWTEIDRIAVTDPEQCHPSVSALVISGGVPAVATAWEDVGVVIPPSQTATNGTKPCSTKMTGFIDHSALTPPFWQRAW
ncbi:MAG: M43 family zinc metalloprotease [Bacteroidia bacterium]|nr:M43 family zinc metalloprotease [Bacteroidia bacterium]